MADEFDPVTGVVYVPPAQVVMRPLASEEVTEVCSALANAQGEVETPKRTKEAEVKGRTKEGREYSYKYKYAPLEEIVRVCHQPLAKHGLCRQQYLVSRNNQWLLRTIIWHKTGQWIANDFPVFPEGMTSQKFAAAVTTARRLGLSLAIGLAPEDDTDNSASGEEVLVETVAEKPKTKGETRAASPLSPRRLDHVALAASEPSTSAEISPDASSAGNGTPPWMAKFLAKNSYEIDPKAAGGWSAWETFYLAAADAVESYDQLLKLQNDNTGHIGDFRAAVKEPVAKQFQRRYELNERRLARDPEPAI